MDTLNPSAVDVKPVGRPTLRPRLSALEPSEVAALAVARLSAALEGIGVPISSRQRGAVRELALEVVRWAKAERKSGARVQARLAPFAALLYGGAADLRESVLARDELEPKDALSLALVAAWARCLLEVGEPVTARQLAALGGCDASHVRRAGWGPRVEGGRVTAAAAKGWLRERSDRG